MTFKSSIYLLLARCKIQEGSITKHRLCFYNPCYYIVHHAVVPMLVHVSRVHAIHVVLMSTTQKSVHVLALWPSAGRRSRREYIFCFINQVNFILFQSGFHSGGARYSGYGCVSVDSPGGQTDRLPDASSGNRKARREWNT